MSSLWEVNNFINKKFWEELMTSIYLTMLTCICIWWG